MAEPGGPGSIGRVSGTPPAKHVRRSGDRKNRRQKQQEEREAQPTPEEPPRKGRYLDEHC